MRTPVISILSSCLALAACGWPSGAWDGIGAPDGRRLAPRRGSIVVEACTLDEAQSAALADGRGVLSEVLLRCPDLDDAGRVAVDEPALAAQVARLHEQGYRVALAASLVDDAGQPLPPPRSRAVLADEAWRASAVATLADLAHLTGADGVELAPPTLDDGARASLTALACDLASALRPERTVGVFAPPSMREPSDLAGGEAFDLPALAPCVDRVRLMTLDFSCCGAGPGPTIDSGWAVDVARLARRQAPVALDLAMPLYGTLFAPDGERALRHEEAVALARLHHVAPQREPSGALHFSYRDGGDQEVWYDDTVSTLRTLSAWSPPTLPAEIGVVFYGLGAEEAGLWRALAEASR